MIHGLFRVLFISTRISDPVSNLFRLLVTTINDEHSSLIFTIKFRENWKLRLSPFLGPSFRIKCMALLSTMTLTPEVGAISFDTSPAKFYRNRQIGWNAESSRKRTIKLFSYNK